MTALEEWAREDLPPIRAAVADKWAESRKAEIVREDARTLEYDWTYTTPFVGGVQGSPRESVIS